jgi:hypothetical protein
LFGVNPGRPVIPCVIAGTDRLYRPANWRPLRRVPVWMVFGEPVYPQTDLTRQQALALLLYPWKAPWFG